MKAIRLLAACLPVLCMPHSTLADQAKRDGPGFALHDQSGVGEYVNPLESISCDMLPDPFPCNTVQGTYLAGTSCPKGDIPWQGVCDGPLSDIITMYDAIPASEQEFSYEFRTVPLTLCDDLPQFWGPSTNGYSQPAPGCVGPLALCGHAIGGLFQTKWCYEFRHRMEIGPGGCDIHSDVVTQGTLDLAGNNGTCDAGDLAGFASLLGTACNVPSSGGGKYNPVADYNKSGTIDGVDLALFAAHLDMIAANGSR